MGDPRVAITVKAVLFADELLRQHAAAVYALRQAVAAGRGHELSSLVAAIDSAHQGAWEELDRARAALVAGGRTAPAYDAIRDALSDAERRIGVLDATNTIGVRVSVGLEGLELNRDGALGVQLNARGASAAVAASAALKATMPDIDWPAAARGVAESTGPVRVGKGVSLGPVLAIVAVAAAAYGVHAVVKAGRGERPAEARRHAPAPTADQLLSVGDAYLAGWLNGAGNDHPEVKAEVLTKLDARFEARLTAAASWRDAAALVDHVDAVGLAEGRRAEAQARLEALLEAAVAGGTLAIEDARELFATRVFTTPVRARLVGYLDVHLEQRLASGADPVEVAAELAELGDRAPLVATRAALAGRALAALERDGEVALVLALQDFVDPAKLAEELPRLLSRAVSAAPDLATLHALGRQIVEADLVDALVEQVERRATGLLRAEAAVARDAGDLHRLAELALAMMDEEDVHAIVARRARRIAASARDFDELQVWLGAWVIDEPTAARLSDRAVKLARSGDLATVRRFLGSDLARLDTAGKIARRVPALCEAALVPVAMVLDAAIAATARDACLSDEGVVTYHGVGSSDQVKEAATQVEQLLRDALLAAEDPRGARLTRGG